MSETAISPPPTPPSPTSSKIDRTYKTLGIVSTSLGILGAVGTVFVGLAMNLYVGDVEIQPDKPAEALIVKVYDNKGHEAVYHSSKFQLMPGIYSLEIIAGTGKSVHTEGEVKFHEKLVVPVIVPSGETEVAQSNDEPADEGSKKHWWQFWRR